MELDVGIYYYGIRVHSLHINIGLFHDCFHTAQGPRQGKKNRKTARGRVSEVSGTRTGTGTGNPVSLIHLYTTYEMNLEYGYDNNNA